jgi:hypothetical protein
MEETFQLVKRALAQFGKPSQWLSNNKGKKIKATDWKCRRTQITHYFVMVLAISFFGFFAPFATT